MLHRFLSAAFVAAFAFGAQAQVIDPQTAWNAAYDARTDGPVDVPLGDQAVFHMADDLFFIPKTEATTLMKAWGNQVDPSFYGLIAPKDNNQPWIVSVKYIREGYVKDEDAASWDKDEMLKSFKQGTLEHNKELLEMGMPGLVAGEVEEPAYDKANHRLVWSLAADEIGAPADAPATVNYNTYALGREGYFEINLLTSDQTIATDEAYAQEILTSVQYNDGKRYEGHGERQVSSRPRSRRGWPFATRKRRWTSTRPRSAPSRRIGSKATTDAWPWRGSRWAGRRSGSKTTPTRAPSPPASVRSG